MKYSAVINHLVISSVIAIFATTFASAQSEDQAVINRCSSAFSENSRGEIIYLPKDPTRYFTYSHDSEIASDEVLKLVYKTADLSKLESHLSAMTLQELLEALNNALLKVGQKPFSQKYFNAWALRKSAVKDLTPSQLIERRFTVFSLNPKFAGLFFSGLDAWSSNKFCLNGKCLQLRQALLEELKKAFMKLGIDSQIGFDGEVYGQFGSIEARTPSHLDHYHNFWETMKHFRQQFPFAASHIHLGVPISVSDERMYAVARIIEMRSMIQNLLQTDGQFLAEGSGENVDSSSLSSAIHHRTEGPYVRLDRDLFKTPFEAHNLEIKGLFKISDVQYLMDFAMSAIVSEKSLMVEKWKGSTRFTRDKRFGHILGAIELILFLIEDRIDYSSTYLSLKGLRERLLAEAKSSSHEIYFSKEGLVSLTKLLTESGLWFEMQKLEFYTWTKK